MQRLFAETDDWGTPWMRRALPQVVRLCEHRPERAVFTRFIPAGEARQAMGSWRRYYERWSNMTLDALDGDMVQLLPELTLFLPPARLFDKSVYSPWHDGRLHALLAGEQVDTVIVSGGETDVCVLATVLGAIDHGYRVIVAADALCGSASGTHDAALQIYHDRFGQQLETAVADEVLEAWT
ncbi:MAG: cysteine hydrolase [Caulobacter sp.]|nr:cysteine hydrolase [Caulobacter sp.]